MEKFVNVRRFSSRNVKKFDELHEMSSITNAAKIIFATDNYFGKAENLLKEEEPIYNKDSDMKCDKWVDGWETQTREEGHDFAIIELAAEAQIYFICIDTAFFTNNFPGHFSIQASKFDFDKLDSLQKWIVKLNESATHGDFVRTQKDFEQAESQNWTFLITQTHLDPGYPSMRKKFFKITKDESFTHVKFNIYPSGGIARLRIYGKALHPRFLYDLFPAKIQFDLVSKIYNGRCISYSSRHSGHPNNLLKPAKAINAADGWETMKHMTHVVLNSQYNQCISHMVTPHSNPIIVNEVKQWAKFKLGCIGQVHCVIIDTSYFQGNAPNFVQVQGLLPTSETSEIWQTIVPLTKVIKGYEQILCITDKKKIITTEIQLIFYPGGGINRFRVFGTCVDYNH